MSDVIAVCVAGATGWTGRAVAEAVLGDADLDLRSAVEVLVDYTSHDVAKRHTLTAVAHGVHVVIGSSGLTAADFAEIDAAARAAGVGVVAAGNFSLTAAMAQAAAPAQPGDRRLRLGRQAGRSERHCPRAGRATR